MFSHFLRGRDVTARKVRTRYDVYNDLKRAMMSPIDNPMRTKTAAAPPTRSQTAIDRLLCSAGCGQSRKVLPKSAQQRNPLLRQRSPAAMGLSLIPKQVQEVCNRRTSTDAIAPENRSSKSAARRKVGRRKPAPRTVPTTTSNSAPRMRSVVIPLSQGGRSRKRRIVCRNLRTSRSFPVHERAKTNPSTRRQNARRKDTAIRSLDS
jgi:hypothetical protein